MNQRVPALLLLLLSAWYLATIREGIEWGDDPSMYILHAANIAEGRPYEATGYIYNPEIASLGPRAYPPVFPALLAPVYGLRGLDLPAMRIFVSVLFLVSLPIVYAVLRRIVPERWPRLAILAVFALSPLVRNAAQDIGSDTAFLLFAYSALLIIDRYAGHGAGWGVVAGACIYLTFGSRFVGLQLVGCLLLLDLWKRRRITTFTTTAAATALLLAALQSALITSSASYLDQLEGWSHVAQNVRLYVSVVAEFFHSPLFSGPALAIAGLVLACAIIGFVRSALQELTIHHLFLVAHVAVIALWPSNQGFRFVYPIMPLALAFSWRGIAPVWPLAPLLAAIVLAGHAWSWTQVNRQPVREGLADPVFQDVSSWIRQNTAPGDVFIFRKPRALALAAGRPSGSYAFNSEVEPFARAIGARYAIVSTEFEEDTRYLEPWLRTRPEPPTLVFQNSKFRVFRLE